MLITKLRKTYKLLKNGELELIAKYFSYFGNTHQTVNTLFYQTFYVLTQPPDFAIILLTKSWALEYAKNNIRVNCVCAAVVDTDMTRNLWLNTKAKRK